MITVAPIPHGDPVTTFFFSMPTSISGRISGSLTLQFIHSDWPLVFQI